LLNYYCAWSSDAFIHQNFPWGQEGRGDIGTFTIIRKERRKAEG